MRARREFLSHSARVATLLAAAGVLPLAARAQASSWPAAAFDAKTLADVMKALGAGAPVESKDVSLTGPDIAENGAVVPVGMVMITLAGSASAGLAVTSAMNEASGSIVRKAALR